MLVRNPRIVEIDVEIDVMEIAMVHVVIEMKNAEINHTKGMMQIIELFHKDMDTDIKMLINC